MFKIEGKWKTYLHSLVGLAVGMAVIFFTIHFLQTRGPLFVQGPAGTVGGIVGGSKWGL